MEGVPIPTGNSENNFIKDRDGNVVISKLNESLGQEIAKAGTGIYVRADNTNSALRALTSEVKKMKKADIESKVYSQYDEQFQGLAWIALLLLIVDVFIVDRKNSWLKKDNLLFINMLRYEIYQIYNVFCVDEHDNEFARTRECTGCCAR